MNSEGRSVEKIQSEEHEKGLKTKMNYSIIGNLPDKKKMRENGAEITTKLFEQILSKNLPNMMKLFTFSRNEVNSKQ